MANAGLKSSLTDTVYLGTCVLATLDLLVMPYKLVIDFGTVNCKCDDGQYRRGKIIVYFNGSYWAANTVITYTFENYFINDNQITGTKTVTNMGRNAANHLWWEVQVNGAVIKANNGGTITKALKKKLNCEWFESGTIDYQIQDLPLIILDYGDGTCDNIATATINGQTYTIHMN